MAKSTGDIGMRAVERPACVAVVIKEKLLPIDRRVTFLARRRVLLFARKLPFVWVGVTQAALLCKRRHAHQLQIRSGILYDMATHALSGFVFANQRKSGLAVIEGHFVPRFGVVTKLAAAFINELAKLTAMHVLVATLASLIREVKLRVLVAFVVDRLRVTGKTWYSQMTSRKGIFALFVVGD